MLNDINSPPAPPQAHPLEAQFFQEWNGLQLGQQHLADEFIGNTRTIERNAT